MSTLTNYDREMKFLRERNEAKCELAKVWPTEAADVPACLDQWVAQIAELMGKDSSTCKLLMQAYDASLVDLEMVKQDTTDDEPSDNEEFAVAHAGGLMLEARRLTAEGRR